MIISAYEDNIPEPIQAQYRYGNNSALRGAILAASNGQSFEVQCTDPKNKVAKMKAVKRYRDEYNLSVAIASTGPTSFRVWMRHNDMVTPPKSPLIEREGKYHEIMSQVAVLTKGETCIFTMNNRVDRNTAIRAVHWFKRKHNLSLYVNQLGEKDLQITAI